MRGAQGRGRRGKLAGRAVEVGDEGRDCRLQRVFLVEIDKVVILGRRDDNRVSAELTNYTRSSLTGIR